MPAMFTPVKLFHDLQNSFDLSPSKETKYSGFIVDGVLFSKPSKKQVHAAFAGASPFFIVLSINSNIAAAFSKELLSSFLQAT